MNMITTAKYWCLVLLYCTTPCEISSDEMGTQGVAGKKDRKSTDK
jgi:hypothetical protein